MTPVLRIVACAIAGLFWLAAIVCKHFWPDINIDLFVTTCAGVIGALGIHGMTTSAPDAKAPQAGFARIGALAALAAVAIGLCALAGCTTTTASVYSGLYTQAKAGVQVFDDSTLMTMHDLLCAQPYSAIQRHPELQAGIVTLCGPLVNTAALDPSQIQTMLGIAKSLNLVPAAAPASAPSK